MDVRFCWRWRGRCWARSGCCWLVLGTSIGDDNPMRVSARSPLGVTLDKARNKAVDVVCTVLQSVDLLPHPARPSGAEMRCASDKSRHPKGSGPGTKAEKVESEFHAAPNRLWWCAGTEFLGGYNAPTARAPLAAHCALSIKLNLPDSPAWHGTRSGNHEGNLQVS